MVLQLAENLSIENLRNHPAEDIEKLRGLLAAGALAYADPRRQNFYELENGCQIFYVHVVPERHKVMLLATWNKDCPAAT